MSELWWNEKFRFIDKDQSLKHFQTQEHIWYLFLNLTLFAVTAEMITVPSTEEIDSHIYLQILVILWFCLLNTMSVFSPTLQFHLPV